MNMASAAARFWPTHKAATTATQSARSAEMRFSSKRRKRVVEGFVTRQERDQDGGVNSEEGLEDAEKIEQQKRAHRGREPVIDNPLFPGFVHNYEFGIMNYELKPSTPRGAFLVLLRPF